MPRRKATRKPAASRRSSIRVEIDPAVSELERKQKIQTFITDFETDRQARLLDIRENGDNLISKITSLFHTELLKIPKPIRDMKFVEFRDKYQSDVSLALLQSTQAELDTIKKPTTVRKGRKAKKKTTMMPIEEDENTAPNANVPFSTARITRTTARVKAPPIWADTPLVTPAINPRLMRAAKPGAGGRTTTAAGRYTFVFDGDSPKIEIPVNGRSILLSKDSELTEESRSALEGIGRLINSMLEQ